MTTVVLHSSQPILIEGLRNVLEAADDLTLSAVCPTVWHLTEHIGTTPPDLLLIDWSPEVTIGLLGALRQTARDSRMILWVDEGLSSEFSSQALALGVRGILRKRLSVELQVKCLRRVAAGELWVEKPVSEAILRERRVALTQRERQVVALLVQGLKNKEIAAQLGLTEGSVKVYLSRLLQKVGVADRFELALFALKHMLDLQGGGQAGKLDPVAVVEMPGSVLAHAARGLPPWLADKRN